MYLNEYQLEAKKFAAYPPSADIVYPTLGFLEEVGEVAEKLLGVANLIPAERSGVAQIFRASLEQAAFAGRKAGPVAKGVRKGEFGEADAKWFADFRVALMGSDLAPLLKEYGDVMWQMNKSLDDMGVKAGDVAQCNLNKLGKRLETGTICGSGDNREDFGPGDMMGEDQ